MYMNFAKAICLILLIFVIHSVGHGQNKFNYSAQKAFIHKDLGKVYLGMPLTKFVEQIDVSKADAGARRYDHLDLDIPYEKGPIERVVIGIHGIDASLQEQILSKTTGTLINSEGETFEGDIYVIDTKKIPTEAFIYAITIKFKSDFDARSYVNKTFGKGGTEHDPSDDNKFYDTQWVKKTSDGLAWLIRSFHADRNEQRLQLLGRIDGTIWGLDGIN